MEVRSFDSTTWPEEKLVPLEVRKGSLIILNGLLPHRSLENKSPKSRHAYTLHLIGGTARYPADNWLQRSTINANAGVLVAQTSVCVIHLK
jgi:phytanoyl-CoA hydroxylase